MRLIDEDALKRKMQKVATEAWKMKLEAKVETTLNQFLDYVEQSPTIEPKCGEWMKTSDDWIDGTCGTRYYPIHCSVCSYSTYDDSATNFCPNCGARMKGVDDED